MDLTPRQLLLAEEFLGNINEDGYLAASLEEILAGINMMVRGSVARNTEPVLDDFGNEIDPDEPAGDMEGGAAGGGEALPVAAEPPDTAGADEVPWYTMAEAEEMLGVIQHLDPPGIACRDLRECLVLQLEDRKDTDTLIFRLVAEAFEDLLFIDIQTGQEDIRTLLPRFEWILKNPDVHLGIDPEFNLVGSGAVPGTKIGTFDAAEVNFVSEFLAELVRKYQLPPKVLTVHRFTQGGVTNARDITLRPEVQVVMHMDGWGAPWLKRDTYKSFIVAEPVQFTGFKLFYHNDIKKGDPLLTPEEVLRLNPKPLYVQYQ
jgi:hypothetical protein